MNMIMDRLPYYVYIKGKRYKINTDYRNMLKFEMIMQDTSIEDKEQHWNEMVVNLFQAFDENMEKNINQSLNMYIKDNNSISTY